MADHPDILTSEQHDSLLITMHFESREWGAIELIVKDRLQRCRQSLEQEDTDPIETAALRKQIRFLNALASLPDKAAELVEKRRQVSSNDDSPRVSRRYRTNGYHPATPAELSEDEDK